MKKTAVVILLSLVAASVAFAAMKKYLAVNVPAGSSAVTAVDSFSAGYVASFQANWASPDVGTITLDVIRRDNSVTTTVFSAEVSNATDVLWLPESQLYLSVGDSIRITNPGSGTLRTWTYIAETR